MKKKSPAWIFFLVIGVIMIIMALKVFEWAESLGSSNPGQLVALLVGLPVLALGAWCFQYLFRDIRKDDVRSRDRRKPRQASGQQRQW